MSQGNHDQLRLGFLTAVEDAERGFVGGFLVTNRFGRPLEFQCTAPVKPNRTQQILYGPTLKPYVLSELIGRTLVEKVGIKPHMIFVEFRDLLELRSATQIPVASLLSADDAPAKRNSNASKSGDSAGDVSTGMKIGSEMVHLNSAYAADRAELEKFAKLIPGDADLREPFERIREALVETIRLSMTRTA